MTIKTLSKPTRMKILVLGSLAGISVFLSACNAVAGVGKDIQEMSEHTKKAIEN